MNFDWIWSVNRKFSKIVVFLSWTLNSPNKLKIAAKAYFIGLSKSLYHFVTVLSTNSNKMLECLYYLL